jgi:hypothetical protein
VAAPVSRPGADWYRSSGAFCNSFRTIAASGGAMPSAIEISGTGLETCFSATVTGDSPVYGSFPVSI